MNVSSWIVPISMILSLIPAGFIGQKFIRRYRDFSAVWLGTALIFLGIWVSTQGISQIVSMNIQRPLLYIARTLGAIIAICILFFTLEYSTGKVITKKLFGLFTVPAALIHSTMLINPELFMTIIIDETRIAYEFGVFGKAHILFVSLLYIVSVTFLFREFLVTEGKLNKQARLLLVGLLAGVVFSFIPLMADFTRLPISPMVIGLIISSGVFSYGLNKYDLYTTTPIQVSTLMDNLDTGIIVLNNSNEVIRINDVAESFTTTGQSIGRKLDDVSSHTGITDFIHSDADTDRMTIGDEHYKIIAQDLDYGRSVSGTVLLIQNTTTVESQKQQLDLLRQIFSRLLRHNIRNKLTIINGMVESLRETTDSLETEEKLDTMDSASKSLLQSSNKAHLLSNATTEDIYSQEIHSVVGQGINNTRQAVDNTNVSINTELQDPTTSVKIAPSSHYIISNILENSIDHVEPPVEISIIGYSNPDDGSYNLRVEDNGDGIPQEEIEVINSNKESSLEHGTGVGLWIIKLLTNHIGGSVTFISSDSGTDIEVSFKKSD